MPRAIPHRALGHWKNRAIAKAWDTWWQHVLWRREKKRIIQRWKQPLKVRRCWQLP